jgi:Flp pilus assembly protein TadD
MKKPVFLVLLMLLTAGAAFAVDASTVAGPTSSDEKIPMVWMEVSMSPKEVAPGSPVALSARLTSPAKSVNVVFDFAPSNRIGMQSRDGLNWAMDYSMPSNIKKGQYYAKVIISDGKNEISRRLDLVVLQGNHSAMANNDKLDLSEEGWTLTMSTEGNAFIADKGGYSHGGQTVRKIASGDTITGLYKSLWYRVRFDDGREGWVMASQVKEPIDQYYQQGYYYYKNQQYSNAAKFYRRVVEMDPGHVSGHYWLAKTYWKMGRDNQAVSELKTVLALDSTNVSAVYFSSVLAQEYFKVAHLDFKRERYQDAVSGFSKVIDLWPSSITTYLELGQAYSKMGNSEKAKETWMQIVKIDPGNEQALAYLNSSDLSVNLKDEEKAMAEKVKKIDNDEEQALTASLGEKDSVEMVRLARTNKGTPVYSAIRMVVDLTKSLGTRVQERGWIVTASKNGKVVTYICDQDRGSSVVRETFEWVVDPATKTVKPNNNNAKLLMSSW